MVDSSKVTAFITALTNKFENKVANKKDSITGDFSSDSASYPTVKAVKSFFGTKVTSWSSTTSDSNYPSEKLVKGSLDDKISKSSTTGLMKNDGSVDTNTYVTTSDSRLTNARTPTSHTHGDITNDGKIGSTSGKPIITTTSGKLTTGSFGTTSGTFCQGNDSRLSDARTPTAHNQASTTITEASALSNIGTSANATQSTINSAINTTIGTLQGIKAIQIVAEKPTASADTMNKLYIVSENSKVNVYYTSQSGSSYSWKKMDTDILDEFSINWSDVQNKPSFGTGANDFAAGNHTHSNASQSANGMMSSTDKTKLDGIATGANAYSHPSQSLGTLPSSAALKKIKYDANGHITAVAAVSASDLPSHTHSYTTTSDVDTEIEAYLDAITTALSS